MSENDCFSHDSWFLFPVTADKLTLGATVADGGHFLQRNVSFWLFSYCPPGQVTHLGKIEEAKTKKVSFIHYQTGKTLLPF